MKRNLDLRLAAKESSIYLWQIADRLGISEMTLSRQLRRELLNHEKEKIRAVIGELKAEAENEN